MRFLEWLFEEHPFATVAMFAIAMIALIVGLTWFGAYHEATSYRKFCDAPVTTWDAVWLDLRIDECD